MLNYCMKFSNMQHTENEMESPVYPITPLVCPHLEHCVHFWAPQFNKAVRVLEGIQRRATVAVKGLEDVSCEEWLRIMTWSALEKGRLRCGVRCLYRFLRRGSGEGGVNFFSQVSNGRIIRAQKERMLWIGRDCQRSPSSTLLQ